MSLRQNGLRFVDDIYRYISLNDYLQFSIEILFKFAPNGPVNKMQFWFR